MSNVLITGASSGIGAALAREFARRGANLMLLARRVEPLDLLAAELRQRGVTVSTHRCDVTVDGDLERAVAEATSDGRLIDVAIANAGFGVVGPAQRLKLDDYRRQFETNVFGVLRTFYATLEFLKRTRGRFVVMGSVAGHISTASGTPYAMSKFAVRALAEGLHGELRHAGVGITLISPGFVDSDIRRVDNLGGLHAEVKDPVPAWLRMNADRAARIMARGILRGRAEVIVTAHAKTIIFFARHFPRLTRFLLVRAAKGGRPEPKRVRAHTG